LNHFDEFLGDRGGVIHAWTHVDFNDPRIQVFVNHKVITDHLKKSLLACNRTLATLNAPDDDAFHLILDDLPLLSADEVNEGLHLPHALLDYRIFIVFLNGVISEMHEFIVDVVQGIVIAAKT
jgi:hypothetical protein